MWQRPRLLRHQRFQRPHSTAINNQKRPAPIDGSINPLPGSLNKADSQEVLQIMLQDHFQQFSQMQSRAISILENL